MTSRTLDTGRTHVEVPEQRIAIDLPPKWRAIDVDPKTLEAGLRSVTDQNPDLGQAISSDAIRQLVLAGVTLYAIDVDPKHSQPDFVNNINVLRQRIPDGTSLDFYSQVNVAQIEELLKVKTVSRRLTINGQPAGVISYERLVQLATGAKLVALRQYIVISGPTAWIITWTALGSTLGDYGDQPDQVAKTFTFR